METAAVQWILIDFSPEIIVVFRRSINDDAHRYLSSTAYLQIIFGQKTIYLINAGWRQNRSDADRDGRNRRERKTETEAEMEREQNVAERANPLHILKQKLFS